MGSDPFDVDDALRVTDPNDQPIFIAPNVKYNSVIGQDTGTGVSLFELDWRSPFSIFNLLAPCPERLFGVRMPFPKISECFLREYPHS